MQSNIVKSAMSYGLVLGVLFSVKFLLGLFNNVWLGLSGYFVIAAILVATYKMSVRFRDNDCEGIISYGKAFSLIVQMFFFAAIISAFVKYIYFQFINPDILESLLQQVLLMYETLSIPITDELYEAGSVLFTPIPVTMLLSLSNLFLGALTGIIMAIFIKKEKNLFDNKKEVQN